MEAVIKKKMGKFLSHSDEVSVAIDGIEYFSGESNSIIDRWGFEIASLREPTSREKLWRPEITSLWVGETEVGKLINPGWTWKPLTLKISDGQVVVPRMKKFKIGLTTVEWAWPEVIVKSGSNSVNQEFLLAILVGCYLRNLEFSGG